MINAWLSRHIVVRRIISVTALCAFFVSIVLSDAWAAIDKGQAPHEMASSEAAPFAHVDADTFTLPAHLGEIKDTWQAPSTPSTIIHIQDAHCNYAAQHKIADIIEHLNKEYGINTVNLEGGRGDYDLSVFTDIGDKRIREEVADYFVRGGLVNGAEYFAANNPDDIKLWGVEDAALYLENLNIYRESLKDKKRIDKSLRSLRHILNNLKLHIYSEELLELDMKYARSKAGNIDFKDYALYLMDKAEQKAIDIKTFANIHLLQRSLGYEERIDFKRANLERDVLIDRLREILSEAELEELVSKTVRSKQKRIRPEDFYAYLTEKARAVNIDLNAFGELQKYIAYITAYGEADKSALMKEIDELEGKIKETSYKNDKQKELALLSRHLALMKDLFDAALKREDHRYYKEHEDSFSIQNFITFINREAPLHKITAELDKDIHKLDEYRQKQAKFYECSFKRDNAFIRNIRFPGIKLRPPTSELKKATKHCGAGKPRLFGGGEPLRTPNSPSTSLGTVQGVVSLSNRELPLDFARDGSRGGELVEPRTTILITGGFHTENLCSLLKENNISYVSIMPAFSNEEGYECPYFGLLSGGQDTVQAKISTVLFSSIAIASFLNGLGVLAEGEKGRVPFELLVEWKRVAAEGNGLVIEYGEKKLALDAEGNVVKPEDNPQFATTHVTEFAPSLQLPGPDVSKSGSSKEGTGSQPTVDAGKKKPGVTTALKRFLERVKHKFTFKKALISIVSLLFVSMFLFTNVACNLIFPFAWDVKEYITDMINAGNVERIFVGDHPSEIEEIVIVYEPSQQSTLFEPVTVIVRDYFNLLPVHLVDELGGVAVLPPEREGLLEHYTLQTGDIMDPGGLYFGPGLGWVGVDFAMYEEVFGDHNNTFVHEFGHHVWFKHLTWAQRWAWKSLHEDSGDDPDNYVSGYAKENKGEDFAETFSRYWLDGATWIADADPEGLLWRKLYFIASLFVDENNVGGPTLWVNYHFDRYPPEFTSLPSDFLIPLDLKLPDHGSLELQQEMLRTVMNKLDWLQRWHGCLQNMFVMNNWPFNIDNINKTIELIRQNPWRLVDIREDFFGQPFQPHEPWDELTLDELNQMSEILKSVLYCDGKIQASEDYNQFGFPDHYTQHVDSVKERIARFIEGVGLLDSFAKKHPNIEFKSEFRAFTCLDDMQALLDDIERAMSVAGCSEAGLCISLGTAKYHGYSHLEVHVEDKVIPPELCCPGTSKFRQALVEAMKLVILPKLQWLEDWYGYLEETMVAHTKAFTVGYLADLLESSPWFVPSEYIDGLRGVEWGWSERYGTDKLNNLSEVLAWVLLYEKEVKEKYPEYVSLLDAGQYWNRITEIIEEIDQLRSDIELLDTFETDHPGICLEAAPGFLDTYVCKLLLDDIDAALVEAGWDEAVDPDITIILDCPSPGETNMKLISGRTTICYIPGDQINPGTPEFRAVLAEAIEKWMNSGPFPIGLPDESPFVFTLDGGPFAQLTDAGIELRDDIPMSDALKDWNIRHEEWHRWLNENRTTLSAEIKEVIAVILAFKGAKLDGHLRVLLSFLGADALDVPLDLSDKDLVRGTIKHLAETRPEYRAALEGKEGIISDEIKRIIDKGIEPDKVQVKSVKEELYGAARNIIPEIIHVIRCQAPTHDIAPANYEGESKVTNLLKAAERGPGKKGHNIHADFYAFGGKEDWYGNLIEKVDTRIADFNEDVLANPATRMTIRLLGEGRREDIREFIVGKLAELNGGNEETAKKIFEQNILIIEEHVADDKHLNTVIDLFADIAMMEYHRYREKAYKDEAPDSLVKDLANLLRLSATNLEGLLSAGNLHTTVDQILKGHIVLMIKAIDWESIPQWKNANDEILRAL